MITFHLGWPVIGCPTKATSVNSATVNGLLNMTTTGFFFKKNTVF